METRSIFCKHWCVISQISLYLFQVIDPSVKLGEFEDLSKVEKYEMKEDDYAKRTGKTVNIWLN